MTVWSRRSSILLTMTCLGFLCLAAVRPGEPETPQDRLLFFYGSLKRGEMNHCRIADQTFVGSGRVRDFGLFVSHPAYPYASALEGARIQGEVYQVESATAAWIDRFEASDGYRPEPVWVRLEDGQRIIAEIYAVSPARLRALGARQYPSATWQGPNFNPDLEC